MKPRVYCCGGVTWLIVLLVPLQASLAASLHLHVLLEVLQATSFALLALLSIGACFRKALFLLPVYYFSLCHKGVLNVSFKMQLTILSTACAATPWSCTKGGGAFARASTCYWTPSVLMDGPVGHCCFFLLCVQGGLFRKVLLEFLLTPQQAAGLVTGQTQS